MRGRLRAVLTSWKTVIIQKCRWLRCAPTHVPWPESCHNGSPCLLRIKNPLQLIWKGSHFGFLSILIFVLSQALSSNINIKGKLSIPTSSFLTSWQLLTNHLPSELHHARSAKYQGGFDFQTYSLFISLSCNKSFALISVFTNILIFICMQ